MSAHSLPGFLIYLEDHQLLLCTRCQHALGPTMAARHLRSHLDDKSEQRGYLPSLRQLALIPLASVHEAIQAQQPIPPLLGLPSPQEGFRCEMTACTAVFSSKEYCLRHLRGQHSLFGSTNQASAFRTCVYQALQKNAYLFETMQEDDEPPVPVSLAGPTRQLPIHPALGSQQISEIASAFEREIRDEDSRPTQLNAFPSRHEVSSFDTHSRYRELLANREPGKISHFLYFHLTSTSLLP